ncbi:MAG: purine-nucleoside phosphorylase [Proteobacteria bacterium]|nr:purine-nucleoside phosphorylase [Pseudomonadota bacterium]
MNVAVSEFTPSLLATAQFLQHRTGQARLPATLVVLGSGFKDFAAEVEGSTSIDMGEIPYFPQPKVAGHGGALVLGTIAAQPVAVLTGRVHLYEGFTPDQVVYPLRALAALGVERVLLTNASGSLDPAVAPGQVVLVRDQINFTGTSCLVGAAGRAFGPLFVDMGQAFDGAWAARIKAVAPQVTDGIYVGVLGPSYETPAEARMLAGLGAQVVGMSTVQEVMAARHLGLKVACLSFVTNMSGGLGTPLLHADVLALAEQHKPELTALLIKAVGVAS